MNGAGIRTWRIELPGSEIARVTVNGADLTLVLAAAQVRGDRRQLEAHLSGGHLQGVRCHLIGSTWQGDPAVLIGRIDEAIWVTNDGAARPDADAGPGAQAALTVPSSGNAVVHMTLRTAFGDSLEVRASAWRWELAEGGAFTPSMAC